MGGHGFYVWGSFGTGLLIVIAEILAVRQRRRSTERELHDFFESQDYVS